jgi:hypothetical protein
VALPLVVPGSAFHRPAVSPCPLPRMLSVLVWMLFCGEVSRLYYWDENSETLLTFDDPAIDNRR